MNLNIQKLRSHLGNPGLPQGICRTCFEFFEGPVCLGPYPSGKAPTSGVGKCRGGRGERCKHSQLSGLSSEGKGQRRGLRASWFEAGHCCDYTGHTASERSSVQERVRVLPNVKTVKWEDSTDLETSWCPELRPQSPRSPHDTSGQPVLGIIV